MLKWLDSISLGTLVLPAVLLGMAPAPFAPEPHLVEKLRMLSQGTLHKPLDMFDLVLHGTPALLVLIKLLRIGTMAVERREISR